MDITRNSARTIVILGRFPPPLDGQSIATNRLAQLLEESYSVVRVNTEPNDGVTADVTRIRLKRVRYFLQAFSALRTALEKYPGAVVIWTSISPDLLGHWRDLLTIVPAFRRDQRIIAVSHRGSFDQLFRRRTSRWTARRLMYRVDRMVFLTKDLAGRCSSWVPRGKAAVIPNTIDEDTMCSDEEVRSKQGQFSGADIQVLFLSNMLVEKGYMDLVQALRLLKERGVTMRAIFAGSWPNEVRKKHFAAEVDDLAVSLAGSISTRTEIKSLMLQADVFVLPTLLQEGMPLTILEALNAGTPVVTTRSGGIPELIQEGENGLFVPPADPEKVARALVDASEPELWMKLSQGARKTFTESYHPDRIFAQWDSLIRSFHVDD